MIDMRCEGRRRRVFAATVMVATFFSGCSTNSPPAAKAPPTFKAVVPSPKIELTPDTSRYPELIRFAMFSKVRGWAIVRRGSSGPIEILKTNDGAATWANVSPEGAEIEPDSMFALDQNKLWIVADKNETGSDPTVLRTSDGGSSWENFDALGLSGWGERSQTQFLDSHNGWSESIVTAAGPKGQTVLTTKNGGRNWKVVAHRGLPEHGSLDNLTDPCIPGSVYFISPKTAFNVGFCGGLVGDGVPKIGLSHDAGRTWHVKQLVPEAGFAEGRTRVSLPVFSTKTASILQFKHFADDSSAAPSRGGLFKTLNRGSSWSMMDLPQSHGVVDFVDSRRGWFLAFPDGRQWETAIVSQLYATQNGGASWIQVGADLPLGPPEQLPRSRLIDFVDAKVGFAASAVSSDLYLLKTVDGGHTWSRLPVLVE